MSACEQCWSAASLRSALGQGYTVDLYHTELVAHPEHGDHQEVDV